MATYQILPHPVWKQEIVFKLRSEQFQIFADLLAPTFEGKEIQIALDSASCLNEDRKDQSWNLYWKARDGQSRVLLAHPEPLIWVGTVLLEKSHMKAVHEKMLKKESLSLEQTGPLYNLGNLHIRFEALS